MYGGPVTGLAHFPSTSRTWPTSMRLALALSLLLAVSSCVLDDGSTHAYLTRPAGGVIHAQSGNGSVLYEKPDQLAVAARLAQIIDEYFELTAESLGYHRGEPVEVWVMSDMPAPASTDERCIVFPYGEQTADVADMILVHEFVHWHMYGTAMHKQLPQALQEGVCELVVAETVGGRRGFTRRMWSSLFSVARDRGRLIGLIEHLDASPREWLRMKKLLCWDVTALTFQIVDQIGIAELREAAARGPFSITLDLPNEEPVTLDIASRRATLRPYPGSQGLAQGPH
jgi:hypothetical protein